MTEKEKGEKLVKAREALGGHWKDCFDNGFRGRTWGSRKNKENPYYGSHVILGRGDEIVIVNLNSEEELQIHGFTKKDDTPLAVEVHELLKGEGLVKN